MSDAVMYLYGFAPDDAALPPRALGGIHGAAVSVIDLGGMFAVVSSVPAADFSADVINENIHDLNWVGARGLEHERVVAWFVDHGDIMPVSLFTMFSSTAALQSDVDSRSTVLRAQMQRLRHQREWDLKISYDATQLEQHATQLINSVRDIDAEIAAAQPGRRFLLEKKRRDIMKRELPSAARAHAKLLFDELTQFATANVTLPLARTEDLAVIWNAALLVSRDREVELQRAAATRTEELARTGIHAQLTGPWAPYRFIEANHDAAV